MKYFIGNWKMFGIPKSINIIQKINAFVSRDINRKSYKVIITPPFTLVESFARKFKKTKIKIGAQNCYHKDFFSSNTGAISPYMLKKINSEYVIIGHSDNRKEGDNDKILHDKVAISLKNNMKVIFCIGENIIQRKKNLTTKILNNQLTKVLNFRLPVKNLIIAYEPIWSIGTGLLPSDNEMKIVLNNIKKTLKKLMGNKNLPPILYGGSVDSLNIQKFKNLSLIDGFLIGGASKSSKKFIDIIKNYYR